jgi:hypothetical protein
MLGTIAFLHRWLWFMQVYALVIYFHTKTYVCYSYVFVCIPKDSILIDEYVSKVAI